MYFKLIMFHQNEGHLIMSNKNYNLIYKDKIQKL